MSSRTGRAEKNKKKEQPSLFDGYPDVPNLAKEVLSHDLRSKDPVYLIILSESCWEFINKQGEKKRTQIKRICDEIQVRARQEGVKIKIEKLTGKESQKESVANATRALVVFDTSRNPHPIDNGIVKEFGNNVDILSFEHPAKTNDISFSEQNQCTGHFLERPKNGSNKELERVNNINYKQIRSAILNLLGLRL